MRIAVVGTGGIGGPYGASLAAAGADVTFVARGAHLTAIRETVYASKGIMERPISARPRPPMTLPGSAPSISC